MLIDSLLVATKPLEYRLALYKPTIPYEKVAVLKEAFNIEFSKTLKEVNKAKLTFTIPYYLPNKVINPNFAKLQIATGYVVYVERYSPDEDLYYMREYMLLQSVVPSGDDKLTLEVTCVGLEQEISKKILTSFKGSKALYRTPEQIASFTPSTIFPTLQDYINSGILNVVIESLNPDWTVGHIDADIASLERVVDVDSSSCLDFLISDVQNSFVSLFTFESTTKTVNCYNLTNLGTNKGLMISNRSNIKSLKETIDFDYVVTKLYIFGYQDLQVNSVSPTGENFILNYEHFRSLTYMSQSLLDALDAYDILVESHTSDFQTLLTQLNTYTTQLSNLQSQLELLNGTNGTLEQLNTERDGKLAREESTTEVDAEIAAVNVQIASLESQITTVQGNITTTNASIQALQTELLMSSNFTQTQLKELSHWTIEKVVTDTSYTDPQQLYDQGVKTLAQINQPSVQIEVDIVDLFSLVECQLDWEKISLGDIAYVRYDDFNLNVELRLISYSHNYESEKLTLTFANRNNLNDPNMIINEVLKTTNSTSTTIDMSGYKWDVGVSANSVLLNYINNKIDVAVQGLIAGGNNEISMDARGLVIKDPSDPNKQVRAMYNGLYCTIDGWATATWALTSEAINAQIIRGVLGQFVTLYADQILMHGDGINQVSIKMTESSGDYTELTPGGLLKYVAYPTYTTSPSGIANQEDFTIHNTIQLLQAAGWESSDTGIYCNVTSNQLVIGMISSSRITSDFEVWARTTQYITKSDTTFSFTYYTGDDGYTSHYFSIDDDVYSLSVTTTSTTWTTSSHSITLTEGYHTFQWFSRNSLGLTTKPYNVIMYIDNIVFEANQLTKTQSGTSTTGSSYNYLTYAGSGSTGTLQSHWGGSVPSAWVQLPDVFKNKDFNVTVFLQDTGAVDAYSVNKISVSVISKDITNAKFEVEAYIGRIYYGYDSINGNYRIQYYTGCDFAFICTV